TLETRRLTTDHHRGIAGLDGDRAARERRIEHEAAGAGELRRDGAARVRRDRAHVGKNPARAQPGDNAIVAERAPAHRPATGHAREYDLAPARHGTGRVGPAHAGRDQRRGLVARPVPAGDAVACGHQARNDQRAHRAETNKTYLHATPRTSSCQIETLAYF